MYDWIERKRRGAKVFEDEMTSCVFGPLRFMEAGQTWACCLLLGGFQEKFSDDTPTRVDVRFWPKFPKDGSQSRYVEPDVHVLAWRDDDLIGTIVVETKWGSSLGDRQLVDQWRFIAAEKYGPDVLRTRSCHAFLSDRPIRDTASIEDQKEIANAKGIPWGDRLIVRSWHQVAARLEECGGCTEAVEVWRSDVLHFLSAVGVIPFGGFGRDRYLSMNPVTWHVETYRLPMLLAVEQIKWKFNDGEAA